MSRDRRLKEINELSFNLYEEKREIEQQVEQEDVQRLFFDGILQKYTYRILEGTNLRAMMVDTPLDELDDYYQDTTFPQNLNLTEDVGLYANFDDRDYFLSATSLEKLVEFVKDHKLEVDVASVKRKIEALVLEAGQLAEILSMFKEN